MAKIEQVIKVLTQVEPKKHWVVARFLEKRYKDGAKQFNKAKEEWEINKGAS